MKVLSLFDGISCGMVALKQLNIPVDVYDAYEIEENAIKVSKYNYPEINHKGDVFNAEYSVGEYDLLIGGSPCTNWSIAKAGRDRETTSSGVGWELFSQFARALQEAKPKYFLYENNESMSDAIKNEITKALGVAPVMINSADFSAQVRKRYYWTNIPLQEKPAPLNLTLKDIIYEDAYRVKDFTKYLDTVKWSLDGLTCSWDTSGKGYYSQQSRCRKIDSKSNTVPASGSDKNNIYISPGKCRGIHPIEAERLQTLPDNYTGCLKSKVKRIEVVGNGWTVDVIKYLMKGLMINE